MKIKKVDEYDRKVVFTIQNSNPKFANALRRVSMNRVPTLAIEEVAVNENSSALFDDVIAQRLGQTPLKFDPEKLNFKDECDCEDGCPNCEVRFKLEKKGSGKVYSGDLVSESDEVEPLYDNIPITILKEEQEVALEAFAVLSTGKDHSKHQAAISSYQYYPDISVDNRKIGDAGKCAKICPRGVFKVKDGKLRVDDELKCNLCNECVEKCGDGIEVKTDETKFIFKLESISGLEPKEILKMTADILSERAEKLTDQIK